MINEELPATPGKQIYLNYLKENNLAESDVLPVVPQINQSKNNPEIAGMLFEGLRSGNADLVKRILEAEKASTNELLALINNSLVERFTSSNIPVTNSAYAGVFPTNSFNAHIVKRESGYLILINTGLFELLETVISLYFSIDSENIREITKESAQQIRQYCENEIIPDQFQIKNFSKDRNRLDFAIQIVTAAEEFVIAHEYGHLMNGHIGNTVTELFINSNQVVKVAARTKDQEIEADMWALNALSCIKSHMAISMPPEMERMVVYSGPLFFFLIAAIIEAYLERAGLKFDTHPPAQLRYIDARQIFAKAGLNSYAQLAEGFMGFSRLVAKELGLDLSMIGDFTKVVIDSIGSLINEGLQEPVSISEQIKQLKSEGSRE